LGCGTRYGQHIGWITITLQRKITPCLQGQRHARAHLT
jgi:hypothetical protein